MAEDDRDLRTPVERKVKRSFEDETLEGGPLSRRARQTRRTVEQYIRAGVVPRYMQRLREIEKEIDRQRRRIDRAHRVLSATHGHDRAQFERRWREQARDWRFDKVNELIHQHNEWYPIERNLPVDPRTRDYVKIRGRSYRRDPMTPEWILEHFPPVPRVEEAEEEAG